MRGRIVAAVSMLWIAGSVWAKTLPVPCPAPVATGPMPANLCPNVNPEVTALEAKVQSALARGDKAGARELERQVQAVLLRQQQVVPHSAPVHVIEPTCLGSNFAPDQRIYDGPVSAMSADYDLDGTMWVAAASASDSIIRVYKSTDGGTSWPNVTSFNWPPKHYVSKIELVAGAGVPGIVYVFENLSQNSGDLYVARFDKSGGNFDNFAVLYGADSITDFAVCRDFTGTGYWLYAVAHNGMESGSYPRSLFLRSTDYGATWAVTDTNYNEDRPRMAFGAGGYGYVSAVPNQSFWHGWVGAGVTSYYGAPGTWHFHSAHPDTFRINDACIAPAFTIPAESAITWLAYSHSYQGTPDWDAYSLYAIGDTLLDWIGPNSISTTARQEVFVDLRNYASPGNPYVDVSYVGIDLGSGYSDAWLGWSGASTPGFWYARGDSWINKSVHPGWGSGTFPRIVYYSPGGDSAGGLVFTGHSSPNDSNGYFNAPWFPGAVSEKPASSGRAPVAFSVLPSVARGPVRMSWSGSAAQLTVTNVAGRSVLSVAAPPGNSFVWDSRVPTGIYLACVTTDAGRATRPVVVP